MVGREKSLGFGLIEVLAALVVIVVGVLGVASLHSISLQYSHIAYLKTQGSILATDMMDRIRSNKEHAQTTDSYKVASGVSVPSSCSSASYSNTCEAGSCTPQQLAQYDISQWKFNILCQLRHSSGSITFVPSVSGRTYVITISFNKKTGEIKPDDFILRSSI